LNEVNDQDDDSDYEQEMDQAATNVADEAFAPRSPRLTPSPSSNRLC
jgi:hypothetical protein